MGDLGIAARHLDLVEVLRDERYRPVEPEVAADDQDRSADA
jgi:hypothetical protein